MSLILFRLHKLVVNIMRENNKYKQAQPSAVGTLQSYVLVIPRAQRQIHD